MDLDVVNVLHELMLNDLHRVLTLDLSVLLTEVTNDEHSVDHSLHEHSQLCDCLFDPGVVEDLSLAPIVFLSSKWR